MKKYFLLIICLLICSGFQNVFGQLPNEVLPKEKTCSYDTAKILVLGTYHMDNPGQDRFNVQADDVLTAKRQTEINELREKLSRFKPTKIAVEIPYRSVGWTSRYKQFIEGKHQLGRNEIEQLGFPLAKLFNHSTIYPVDFPMWMNGWQPSEIESPKPKSEAAPVPAEKNQPTATSPAVPIYIAKGESILRTGTILEYYRYLNSDEYVEASHIPYMDNMLPPTDSVYIYQGADLLTNWYKRNIRIFTNLNRIIDSPSDRVMLIIGSGHTKILRDFAIYSPQICLVDTSLYLK